MRRLGVGLLELFLAACVLAGSGWPRDSCARCVRLLEEPLISVPSYAVPAPETKGPLMAGAARVDITPPPGFPLGGNGFAATFGRGYWTRLYARAFFFRDVDGQTLALVSCDLNAMSGGLQARVAWLLRQSRLNLTRDNLVITATHTHQGPGNFMSFKVYNDEGSPEPGFDPRLFDWLAERIASAITTAAGNAADSPAGTTTELVFRQAKVKAILRNRAPDPFLLNPDRDDVVQAGPSVAGACPEPHPDYCPRYRAVDETLSLLDIERKSSGGARERVGSLVFLSVHPEAMSHETALYQSDFTGLAMALLERKDPSGRLVSAFFNGAEGDISVRWERQDRNDAIRFARSLVGSVEDARAAAGVTLDAETRFRVARTEVKPNPYFTGPGGSFQPLSWCDPDHSNLCLARQPRFGVATAGGAEDARTALYDLGWKPGVRWPVPRDRQGVKQGAFETRLLPGIDLTDLVAPTCFYPESFPLSVIHLAGKIPLTFAAVPGELTRTAWWRIKNTLEKAPDLGRALPLGLANDYIFYLPTKEEYAAQGYEGASDIFGPMTAEVVRRRLEAISRELHAPIPGKAAAVDAAAYYPDWRTHQDFSLAGLFSSPPDLFNSTGAQRFGPDWLDVAHPDPDEGLENLIVDAQDIPFRHWPRFSWFEEGVDDWSGSSREVRILSETRQLVDDDQGENMLTVFRNPPPSGKEKMPVDSNASRGRMHRRVKPLKAHPAGARHWMAVWLAADKAIQDQRLYFSVTINDARRTTRCSEPFTLREVWNRPPRSIPEAPCP